jgi:hypothetical protein
MPSPFVFAQGFQKIFRGRRVARRIVSGLPSAIGFGRLDSFKSGTSHLPGFG